jgi:hypothetical protein
MDMHDKDCQGYEDCRCFHVMIRKERHAAMLAVVEAARRATEGVGNLERFESIGGDRLEALDDLAEAIAKMEKPE